MDNKKEDINNNSQNKKYELLKIPNKNYNKRTPICF